MERTKNSVYKRKAGRVRLGFFWFGLVRFGFLYERSILETPATNVEPSPAEMTFPLCHKSSGSNIDTPKHQLQEGDGISPQHYTLTPMFVEELWKVK